MWWIIAILVGIGLMIFGVIAGAKSDDDEEPDEEYFPPTDDD